MYFIMVCGDLYLSYSHEKSNGPYKFANAQIVKKNAWCERVFTNVTTGNHDVELIINDSTYKTTNPYIGLYPMRLCLFQTYIPLYDYNKVSNVKVGDIVQVIITNDGKVYLGRTSYAFNITTMIILLFFIFLLFYFNKSLKPTPKSSAS